MSAHPLPGILVVGANHQFASLELRERLAFGPERIPDVLLALVRQMGGEPAEAVLLSTCNRTEIYAAGPDPHCAEAVIRESLALHARLAQDRLSSLLYVFSGQQAVEHLLSVSAGLDSLLLGENEILGQVRTAGEIALQAGASGPVLSALFRSAVQAGKRVRAETEIGKAGQSLGKVVAELASETFGSLQGRTALLVGAGKISSITAQALVKAGLTCVLVTNRTYEKAQRLAQSLGSLPRARAVRFDALAEHLAAADLVICSTGAPHTVLHTAAVAQALPARPQRPLLVMDLAVPRDVDPEVGSLPGVRLMDIDRVESLVAGRCPLTASAVAAAGEIVDEEAARFAGWYGARRCTPLIQALNRQAARICQEQVETTLRRLGTQDVETRQAIEAMSASICSKLLHHPLESLKNPPEGFGADRWIELFQSIFDVEALADRAAPPAPAAHPVPAPRSLDNPPPEED